MKTSILIICCLIFTYDLQSQVLDSVFNNLKYRSIGPFRGGRANAGMGVIDDPLTYYMGTTGGASGRLPMRVSIGLIVLMGFSKWALSELLLSRKAIATSFM